MSFPPHGMRNNGYNGPGGEGFGYGGGGGGGYRDGPYPHHGPPGPSYPSHPSGPVPYNQGQYNLIEEDSPLERETQLVIREMLEEKRQLDRPEAQHFKNARRVLATEVDRLEHDIDPEWLEVDIMKPIKLVKKVIVPTFRYTGNFNFVGKLMGRGGSNLQNIAKKHNCHLYVLGRGSTKDHENEVKLLSEGDPKYSHFAGPLHVKIETIAPAHIAYARIAGVLEELHLILQPTPEIRPPRDFETASISPSKSNPSMATPSPATGGAGRGAPFAARGGGLGPMRGRGRGRGLPPGYAPY